MSLSLDAEFWSLKKQRLEKWYEGFADCVEGESDGGKHSVPLWCQGVVVEGGRGRQLVEGIGERQRLEGSLALARDSPLANDCPNCSAHN